MRRISCFNFYKFKIGIYGALNKDYNLLNITTAKSLRHKHNWRQKVAIQSKAERINPNVKFTKEACAKLTKIPRIFLKAALTQMVDIAKEENISLIDENALTIINDKRRKEKKDK